MKTLSFSVAITAFAVLMSAFLTGCGESDTEIANRMAVEAKQKWDSLTLASCPDPTTCLAQVREIKNSLDKIVTDYPTTDMAVQWAGTGEVVGITKDSITAQEKSYQQLAAFYKAVPIDKPAYGVSVEILNMAAQRMPGSYPFGVIEFTQNGKITYGQFLPKAVATDLPGEDVRETYPGYVFVRDRDLSLKLTGEKVSLNIVGHETFSDRMVTANAKAFGKTGMGRIPQQILDATSERLENALKIEGRHILAGDKALFSVVDKNEIERIFRDVSLLATDTPSQEMAKFTTAYLFAAKYDTYEKWTKGKDEVTSGKLYRFYSDCPHDMKRPTSSEFYRFLHENNAAENQSAETNKECSPGVLFGELLADIFLDR